MNETEAKDKLIDIIKKYGTIHFFFPRRATARMGYIKNTWIAFYKPYRKKEIGFTHVDIAEILNWLLHNQIGSPEE